jgi:hypothetical protein
MKCERYTDNVNIMHQARRNDFECFHQNKILNEEIDMFNMI